MHPIPHRRQRGTALIITVGLLAVLAVIGFGFAVMARLQHDISRAYRASAQNDLIAQAAIQYAVGEIRYGFASAPPTDHAGNAINPGQFRTFQTGAINDPVDDPSDTWFVDPTIASQGYTDPDGDTRYCNLRCNSFALIHDDLGSRLGVSNIKVLDCAGKLNINDRDGTPPDSLDTSNVATHATTVRLHSTLKALLLKLGYNTTQATDIADTILLERNNLPDKRFGTLEELRTKALDKVSTTPAICPARTFELLKHYVTIYSWPHQLAPVSDAFPYTINPASGYLDRKNTSTTAPAEYYYRSPININTAGKELLYAILTNVKAADGTMLTPNQARDLASWICRKREPLSTDHWDDGTPGTYWTSWVNTQAFDDILERKVEAASRYPLGRFDNWGEVIAFLYSLTSLYPADASNPNSPFPTDVFGSSGEKRVETIIAALSPDVYATSLAGYNAWHLGIARLKKDPAVANFREQTARDWDTTGPAELTPQVLGAEKLAADNYTYPICFSSMGRHELYTRTYTFLKIEEGTVTSATKNTLADNNKTWLSSPSQWRGYSVVIYDGKGKGQMRGILYVKPFSAGSTTGNTLVVDRWSTIPDATSRYYIVGPGAFLDRVPESTSDITTPDDFTIQDTKVSWEDGQWNGHRVLVYRASLSGQTETIDDDSLQERTIIDTIRVSSTTGRLIVFPDLDPDLMTQGAYTAYIILGCDGMVAHAGAIKAYDVVHHTTQDDFEPDTRPASASAGRTYAATGPNLCRKADGSRVPSTQPSEIDGWIAARRYIPTGLPAGALHVNFTKESLEPDAGGSLVGAPVPALDVIRKDAFEGGSLLADGLRLYGGAANHVDYSPTSAINSNSPREGGFVSFWFRPDEAFFSGSRTIVKIMGEAGEDISLMAAGAAGARTLSIVLTTKGHVYEQQLPDGNHKPANPAAPDVTYKQHTVTYSDATYSDISGWRPGEWHHIAFAWHECINDTEDHNMEAGYNTDSNIGTDWRDDDQSGAGGKPDYVLDDEVACLLRLWVDGNSSNVTKAANEKPAFNLYAPAAGTGAIRLSGEAGGTIDCLIAMKHTDKNLAPSTFTAVLPPGPRYDGFDTGTPDSTKYAEYESAPITISNPGSNTITLGTITWNGFLPWMKEADRWGGPGSRTNKYPIRAQAALGATWSSEIPENGKAEHKFFGEQPVFSGGPLLNGSSRISSSASSLTLKYRLLLYPRQGTVAADNQPGLLQGRQTPVVESVTVTYLGPVVFYFWQ